MRSGDLEPSQKPTLKAGIVQVLTALALGFLHVARARVLGASSAKSWPYPKFVPAHPAIWNKLATLLSQERHEKKKGILQQ